MSRCRALVVGAVALGACLVPPSLRGQRPLTFEAFAARQEPSGSPLLGGLAFAGYSGVWGVRVGGALHLVRSAPRSQMVLYSMSNCEWNGCRYDSWGHHDAGAWGPDIAIGAWTADADLILEPLRTAPVPKALLLGFSPYGFVGIGGAGVRPAHAPDSSLATMSYGVGVHHEMLSWLGMAAEARYRRPLSNDTVSATDWHRRLEYRVALTVSFGGPHRYPRDAQAAIEPPRVSCDPDSCASSETHVDVPEPALASRIVDRADGYVGVPYRRHGSDPATGFDAAGFVRYVFAREGIRLSHGMRGMARDGHAVSTRAEALRPGDLLFFASDGSRIDHVAIYAGHERIIHASGSAGAVRYDLLGEGARGRWYADHLVTARRVERDRTGSHRWRWDAPWDDDDGDRAPPP